MPIAHCSGGWVKVHVKRNCHTTMLHCGVLWCTVLDCTEAAKAAKAISMRLATANTVTFVGNRSVVVLGLSAEFVLYEI